MNETRTLRSSRVRAALHRASSGRCGICGQDLGSDWEADHIVPWSKGGATDIANMQALCSACNKRKGSSLFTLRHWQSDAFSQCNRRNSKSDFFVEATPGAGKTSFACHVASEYIKSDIVKQLIVVVPTTALKEQWCDVLHRAGLDAEIKYVSGPWPPDFKAICVTYQQVASDPTTYRYLCSRTDMMVILDEVHHCADDSSWGESIRQAFELATFRLCLSGTPFRSDNNTIPFLNYVDGTARPDYPYGYSDGLRDQICRHIYFPRQGGVSEWITPHGRIVNHTFDEDLPDSMANQRLRTALTTGEWIKDTIRDANKVLTEMRQEDPDAAGLVIAIDHFHAKEIRRKMCSSLAIDPDIVLSDDPDAQTKLKAFKESSRPWIIAVRMVSEGVDIPRLRVGVYATTAKTEMFFRQAVGRFVRVEDGHDDPTASVFIPDDPTLRRYAEEIRSQRLHHLEKELREEKERRDSETEDYHHDCSRFMPLNSTAENRGTIIDEATFTREQLEEARMMAHGQCKPEIAAVILHRSGYFSTSTKQHATTQTKPDKRKTDIRKELRAMNSKLAKAISASSGREHSHVNHHLNEAVGIESIKTATLEQLRRRIAVAEKMLTERTGSRA